MTDPLSTDCPARQLARQFITKFRQDHGLEKSAKKKAYAEEITAACANGDRTEGRVIGRWGSHFLRANFLDCEIGDAIPFEASHPDAGTLKVYDHGRIEKRRFKKVCCETMWSGVLITKSFWERVE